MDNDQYGAFAPDAQPAAPDGDLYGPNSLPGPTPPNQQESLYTGHTPQTGAFHEPAPHNVDAGLSGE